MNGWYEGVASRAVIDRAKEFGGAGSGEWDTMAIRIVSVGAGKLPPTNRCGFVRDGELSLCAARQPDQPWKLLHAWRTNGLKEQRTKVTRHAIQNHATTRNDSLSGCL